MCLHKGKILFHKRTTVFREKTSFLIYMYVCLCLCLLIMVALSYEPVLQRLVLKIDIGYTGVHKCEQVDERFAMKEQTWISIPETKDFFFSAFLDDTIVRVIGISETSVQHPDNNQRTVQPVNNQSFCRLRGRGHNLTLETYDVLAEIDIIPGNHGKRYTATFYKCKLPKDEFCPEAVSLVSEVCKNNHTGSALMPSSEVYVPILRPRGIVKNFTLCVSPFHSSFDRSNQLVEMIELNRLLGTDYFIFYNHSITETVNDILKYYLTSGLVEVIQWHLPVSIQNKVQYSGQFAAINDCLYRCRLRSKYVVYQDVDEFIIPRKHNNWHEMMKSLSENHGCYIFRSSLFPRDWMSITGPFSNKSEYDYTRAMRYRSVAILHQIREKHIYPWKYRSKYICRTECLEIAVVHYRWTIRNIRNCSPLNVHPSEVLVHHYRASLTPPTYTVDKRIAFWQENLLVRINNSWTQLKKRNVRL